MAGKNKRAETTVFLEGLRAKWYGLDKPDYTYKTEGSYGVGAILDAANVQILNAAIAQVAKDGGEQGKTYTVGELVKATMKASARDRKTGDLLTFTPLVYMPDLSPATAENIGQLGRNSKFTLKLKVASYPDIGDPAAGGKKGGVSVKFAAMQILDFDAGEPTATEEGFTAVGAVDSDNEGF